MASVYRKAGASGKMSPYWQAKFAGPDARPVSKTTELTDRKAALSCGICSRGQLSQAASMQLLDRWMQMTTGERFNVPTVEKYCQDWLEAKKNVGKTSASTLVRYEPVLQRFVESLPAIRRRLPMSCVTAKISTVSCMQKNGVAAPTRQATSVSGCCVGCFPPPDARA